MQIALTPAQEAFIQHQIAAGVFASPDAVVAEALRLLAAEAAPASALTDARIRRILTLPGQTDDSWEADLRRLEQGDGSLTRASVGEASISAIQRMLIFLGYSTTSRGAFAIDGDFGRGTNRGVAQFQFEHGLNPALDRATLCYDCTWQNAHTRIVAIPDARLDVHTERALVAEARRAIATGEVLCGSFDEAVFHLDAVHRRRFLSCREIRERYGADVAGAVRQVRDAGGPDIRPEWVLALIKQETGGIVRPRFEQHLLTRFHKAEPGADFRELRFRAMSFGLGQILGVNYEQAGAPSARAMFASPPAEQVLHIARFIIPRADVVTRLNPSAADFRRLARYYNGPGYEAHHYHESLTRWFMEFRQLL